MNTALRIQAQRDLAKYFNTGCLTRGDLLLSVASRQRPFHRNADRILDRVRPLMRSEGTGNVREIRIDAYSGANARVGEMIRYVQCELAGDLVGAYVHGSLATGEETSFSDFDALAIVRNEVFDSRSRLVRTACKLGMANKIMLRFDPLQHHGWFILIEKDLMDYPQDYLPHEILYTAKSLLTYSGTRLRLRVNTEEVGYTGPLLDATSAIISRVRARRYPRNMYELKALLSRFMLLPALYCAAIHQTGVPKKDGFEMARSCFDGATYQIMDEVSHIRATWNYDLAFWRRWILTSNRRGLRRAATRFAPPIPPALRDKLTEDFFQRMCDFCLACNRGIHATAVHRRSTACR
jgi:hypothetical protein